MFERRFRKGTVCRNPCRLEGEMKTSRFRPAAGGREERPTPLAQQRLARPQIRRAGPNG